MATKLIQLRPLMLILLPCFLLAVTALALVNLRLFQPTARYGWLAASGGATLAWFGVFLWLGSLPSDLILPAWSPPEIFTSPILFRADSISFPLALCIATLTVSTILTAAAHPARGNLGSWAGSLALGAVGILAVTADNPLTLLLVWAALDLTELATQLGSVKGAANNEKVVISFSTRTLGTGALLWAGLLSLADGSAFDFQTLPAGTGAFLALAAGLRLGVLPLHLPYAPESELRRGFGTSFRLISAASSLVVLGRVPVGNPSAGLTQILMILAVGAGLYAGWMWLRAPDELSGRPYWVIGLAALSVLSALSGNPLGAIAWGCALILCGAALFLASEQNGRLDRITLVGAWSLSSLPFSLTASVWLQPLGWIAPLVIAAQALLTAGYVRHALRPVGRAAPELQTGLAGAIYPSGILLLVFLQLFLGGIGWEGARQIGAWLHALIASLVTLSLLWASRRFRVFNPVRAHWVASAGTRLNSVYQWLWSLYRGLAGISAAVTRTLEGEGGILWTLLFLALFVSLIAQGAS
jgi:hypothetical protein